MPQSPLGRSSMSKNTPTLISARWIVTMTSDNPGPPEEGEIIENGCVVVENGRIAAVGPATDIRKAYQSRKVYLVELPPNHIIIPGLINCHTHLAMSMLRGYADDKCLSTWLNDFVWPTEKAIMAEDFVYQGVLIACFEALRSGCTMLNDSYFLPEAAIRATREAGIRSVHAETVLDFGDGSLDNQFKSAMAFIDQHVAQIAKESPEDNLVRVSFTPHAAYTVPGEYLAKGAAHVAPINQAHPEAPVVFHSHLHETKAERVAYEEGHGGKTAIQVMDEAGLLTPTFVGAHCIHMNPDEVKLMAERKANVCHCPKSNFKLASGFCPAWSMLKAGVNVCLGTDGGCSNNSVDMLSEMQFAALVGKAVCQDPTALDAYSVLRMATRNGSRALGRLHDLGSIEVGKLADLVAVDLAGDNDVGLPIFDPISHLIYTTHRRVTNVWIGGRRVVEDGFVKTISISESKQEAVVRKLQGIRADLFARAAERENIPPS